MKRLYFVVCGLLVLAGGSVAAQSFGNQDAQKSSASSAAFEELLKDKRANSNASAKTKAPSRKTDDELKAQLDEEQELLKKAIREREEVFVPFGGVEKLFNPTLDGSKRGNATFLEEDENGNNRANSNIFVYMDDFAVFGQKGDIVTCDMTFVVLTNLDQKLNSLDMKLVWPEMTTAVSFQNIPPNTPRGFSYTLIGDGCYSMDKIPNIIVNRCRIKGIGAAACAEKIVWLNKTR